MFFTIFFFSFGYYKTRPHTIYFGCLNDSEVVLNNWLVLLSILTFWSNDSCIFN